MKKIIQSKWFKLVFSASLALAFYFFTPACLSRFWVGMIVGSLFLINNLSPFMTGLGHRFRWFEMVLTVFTQVIRFFVGGLFIFSGMIKSNDPTGFSYKLQEYFEVFTEDFAKLFNVTDVQHSKNVFILLCDYFHHHSLGLAIIVCVSEVALGFLLLIGWKRMLTLWLLLAQIVFFTFLTFYSACYSKVTGCGCFGDFIKLAPWESFWKDIILLVAISFLFAGKHRINPVFKGGWKVWLTTILAVGISIWFPIYTYRNLPMKDFLAYAEGKDICKGQQAGPKYVPAKYMSYFIYQNLKTGKDSTFDQDHMPWQDTLTWKYVSAGETKLISKEVDGPEIIGFSITDTDGNEIKDSILNNKDYYFLLISWNLDEMDKSRDLLDKINRFYLDANKEGLKFMAISAASADSINAFKHRYQALYDFGIADGVLLKTMIRSNPGLFLMKGCSVLRKWHHNNFPAFSEVKSEYFK